jgi:hypothetical protein
MRPSPSSSGATYRPLATAHTDTRGERRGAGRAGHLSDRTLVVQPDGRLRAIGQDCLWRGAEDFVRTPECLGRNGTCQRTTAYMTAWSR